MKESVFKAYQNQSWVLGVSGGPDSMALLDMAKSHGLKCIVVHVNYHKRESAYRDQRIVEEYCNKHDIKCFVYDAPKFEKGNFQKAARTYRYQKMIDVLNKVSADVMAVAHHQNDDLETYLFQKRRKSNVDVFGLSKEVKFKNTLLIRPLLDFTKDELINYCNVNSIDYGLDESNLDLIYSRNKIRKDLEDLSEKEIVSLFKEKEKRNLEHQKYLQEFKTLLTLKECTLETFKSLKDKDKFLLNWLKKHHVNKAISDAFIKELVRQIEEVSSFVMDCGDLRIVKQYGKLSLLEKHKKTYEYIIDNDEDRNFDEFTLLFTINSKIHINLSDFPLKIKSCEGNEKIGNISLNRWFIKHKIPLEKRELWPVIYNTNGKLLYIVNRSFLSGANANKITLTVVK